MRPLRIVLALGGFALLGCAPVGDMPPPGADLGSLEWRDGRIPLRSLLESEAAEGTLIEAFRARYGGGMLWAGQEHARQEPRGR